MKSAKCDNCGAAVTPGAFNCVYCGTTFTTTAPGVAPAPAGVHPEIVRLLREGKKIEAIKVYREANRSSLLDAKNAVEAVERTLLGRR